MRFLIALLGLMLAGCTAPLKPVSFDQPVAASSDLAATVVLVAGAVRGSSGTALVPAGTVFVPLSNAQEGKAKAGKKLMQQLIPDVAAYIAENPKPTGQTL